MSYSILDFLYHIFRSRRGYVLSALYLREPSWKLRGDRLIEVFITSVMFHRIFSIHWDENKAIQYVTRLCNREYSVVAQVWCCYSISLHGTATISTWWYLKMDVAIVMDLLLNRKFLLITKNSSSVRLGSISGYNELELVFNHWLILKLDWDCASIKVGENKF
jgi:hypothetical protein